MGLHSGILASWDYLWLTNHVLGLLIGRAVLVRRGGRQYDSVVSLEDGSRGRIFNHQTPSFTIERTALKASHMKNATFVLECQLHQIIQLG